MGLPIQALRAELEAIKRQIPPSGKEAVIGVLPFRRQGETVAQFEIRAMTALLPFMGGSPSVRLLIHVETPEAEAITFGACSSAVKDAFQAVVESFPTGRPADAGERVQAEPVDPLS